MRHFFKHNSKKVIFLNVFYFTLVTCLVLRGFQVIVKRSLEVGLFTDASKIWVNYQGGFVRRGLIGEVIFQIYSHLGIPPFVMAIIINVSSYVILCVVLLRLFKNKGYTIFILPFVCFLGAPIFWGTVLFFTDILLILLFILSIIFAQKKGLINLIIVNIFLMIGLLIHESIIFFSFPIILLILINNHTTKWSIKSIVTSVTCLLPSIFVLLCVVYFHGTPVILEQIILSWKYAGLIKSSQGISAIPVGIELSLQEGLAYLKYNLVFADGIYAPLAWLVTIFATYFLLTNTEKLNYKIGNYVPYRNFNKQYLSSILIFQFLSISPLFIIGCDYGRWISFWSLSSFVIILLLPEQTLYSIFSKFLFAWGQKLNNLLNTVFSPSRGFVLLLCLMIGLPVCSWTLVEAIKSSALYFVGRFISLIIEYTILLIDSII